MLKNQQDREAVTGHCLKDQRDRGTAHCLGEQKAGAEAVTAHCLQENHRHLRVHLLVVQKDRAAVVVMVHFLQWDRVAAVMLAAVVMVRFLPWDRAAAVMVQMGWSKVCCGVAEEWCSVAELHLVEMVCLLDSQRKWCSRH